MFDWVKLELERFTQPLVIVGLIIMILGLVLVLCSRSISSALSKKITTFNVTIPVYICSIAILLAGVFMLVFGAK